MDHDTFEPRIRKLEETLGKVTALLDSEAPGWRDGSRGGHRHRVLDDPQARQDRPQAHPDMIVDEEQTKRDRRALGFDKTDDDASGPKDAGNSESAERQELLTKLKPFRGTEGAAELTGKESNEELRALLAAHGRETGRGRADAPTRVLPGESGITPANAVALEAARASPATEQALQTAQDPERQERAEAQRDLKEARDESGVPAENRSTFVITDRSGRD